jgi:ferredoxin-NADP reductase
MFVSVSFIRESIPYGPKPFSVASSPLDRKKLELCVRKSGDTTTNLFQLQKGDKVTIIGPMGNLMLEEPIARQLVLLAGGTGIAPLMSMIRYTLAKKFRTHVSLIFSAKTQHDILYHDELEHLAEKHDNFSFVITLTQELEGTDWSGPRGRISEELLKDVIHDRHHADCYVCGPAGFVESAEEILQDLAVPQEHVHREKW